MALTVGELLGKLRLDAGEFDRGVDDSERKMGGLAGSMVGLAKKAAIGTGLAMAGVSVAGVKSFGDLQQGMNEVFTLMPGISQSAMDDMTGQVKQFATDFGVLPKDVVPALYQSLSAGVPADNVFEFLETAQKAAKGGVTDLTTAVDGISSVVNAYGEDVVDATKASDLMFTAVKLGKTNFEQLSASLYNVTPTAAALGVEFGDVTAALAAMTAQGVPTSVATTQLRQLFVELSKEGTKTSDTFQKIAGKSFKEFVAEGGNTQDALQLLEQHAKDTGVGINDLFGSVEAGGAALALTGKGTDKFSDALDGMAGSAGATDTAFSTMDKGINASFGRIRATLAVFLIEVGEKLAPTVERFAGLLEKGLPVAADFVVGAFTTLIEVAGVVASVMRDVATWVDANRTPILVVAGLIAAVFIPHLIALGVQSTIAKVKVVAAWIAKQAAAVSAAAVHSAQIAVMVAKWVFLGAQSLLHAGKVAAAWLIAMGPIGLVIAAVIGLVALIIANWDKIWSVTKKVWGWIWDKIKAIGSAIAAGVKGYVNLVISYFQWWASLPGKVAGWIGRVKDGAIDKLRGLVDWIKGLPGRILDALGNLGSLLLDAGKDLIRGLWDGIVSMGSWLVDKITGFVADKIPGPIKKVLGISSPSRVMAEQVGRWIPAGVAEGITRNSGVVQKAMEQLGKVPTVTVPVGARRGGDGASAAGDLGGGVHQHDHYHLDSAAAARMAKEWAEQVDKIKRRRKSVQVGAVK